MVTPDKAPMKKISCGYTFEYERLKIILLFLWIIILLFVLVGLEFNGPVNTIKVISSRSVYLHTYPGQALSKSF